MFHRATIISTEHNITLFEDKTESAFCGFIGLTKRRFTQMVDWLVVKLTSLFHGKGDERQRLQLIDVIVQRFWYVDLHKHIISRALSHPKQAIVLVCCLGFPLLFCLGEVVVSG